VNIWFTAATAAADLVIGWGQRIIIFCLTAPAGDPQRLACTGCVDQIPAVRLLMTPFGRRVACRARTGPPPVTAITAAVVLGALAARVHPAWVLAAAAWLAVCASPLAWIDAAVHRLPNLLTGWAYCGTVALLLLAAASGGHWHNFLRAAAEGLAFAGFCLVLSTCAMGLGRRDCKLAGSLGARPGWSSWVAVLEGALAGFVIAGAYGAAVLAAGRGAGKRIAVGPFMITGAFAVILFLTHSQAVTVVALRVAAFCESRRLSGGR
jgi:leader peptidase (prepilin peptidase) / N-methyltransferase